MSIKIIDVFLFISIMNFTVAILPAKTVDILLGLDFNLGRKEKC